MSSEKIERAMIERGKAIIKCRKVPLAHSHYNAENQLAQKKPLTSSGFFINTTATAVAKPARG
jgi:hypothetical protein